MTKITKRLILYFILLAMAIYIMIALWNVIHRQGDVSLLPRDYPEIVEEGVLNMVTDYNAVGYHVEGDTLAGFQYELMRALERDWGVEVRLFLENSLDESFEGLREGKYDIVARNIAINSQLLEQFAFSQFLHRNKLVLVQRKMEYNDSIEPIRQHLELAGQTIYLHKDAPAKVRIDNLANEIGDTIYIIEEDRYEAEQLVMMVAGGDIDLTVADREMARRLADVMPELDVETDISFTQLESWALRHESPQLLDSLNAWLQGVMQTKEFESIQKKYLE